MVYRSNGWNYGELYLGNGMEKMVNGGRIAGLAVSKDVKGEKNVSYKWR